LVDLGYDVILTARREEPLRAAAEEMGARYVVAEAVAWLDTVDPSVDVPEIRLHAITRGPAAREPVVPIEVERRAAKP
jgi:hypothetical protein